MITLSNIPSLVSHKKKRLGRGTSSGKGAKSGRGTTRHQSARQDIKLFFEGGQNRLTKKFPLLRGKGRNKPVSPSRLSIPLDKLEVLKEGQEVTRQTLIDAHIIRINDTRELKILAHGILKKGLIIKLPISQKARKLVEKVKGSVLGV